MQRDENHFETPRGETAPAERRSSLIFFFGLLRRGWRFFDVMAAHNGFEGASAIAFWFFLSLIPLLVFVGWGLGILARTGGIDFIVEPALELLPGQAAEALIRKELERMAGPSSTPVGPISIVGFLWTASSGLHNLMDIFEIAVRVRRRPWWKQRALALASIVIGLSSTGATAWTLLQIDASVHGDSHSASAAPPVASSTAPFSSSTASPAPSGRFVVGDAHLRVSRPDPSTKRAKLKQRMTKIFHTPWEETLAGLAMLVVATTLLAAFYRFAVEHPPGIQRRAWPGAVVAVVGWVVVSWGFGGYVSSLGDYALYYGGLAAVAVILIWLYLTSLALVFGAEVNAQLEGVRD